MREMAVTKRAPQPINHTGLYDTRKSARKSAGWISETLRHLWASVLLVTFGMSIPVLGQSGVGSIQGTVTDSTGAVIAGATVQVVNQATRETSITRSNGGGFYSAPALFTGNYTLTFSMQSMKQFETSLSLQVGQTAVVNASLSPGSVTEKVTVAGEAIQLATYDSPTISSTLENNRINQLPMNGRNVLTLTGLTTPGLEANGTRQNGNMAAALEYVQDGATMSNRNQGGTTRLPDPDTVQEVRLETTVSGAELAAPATGIITTKSGTNQLHGSLFETMRNNYFGVARARQNPSNYVAPHLVRNEFGVSVGGPIVIPKLYNGKDRSFFFFAYERLSLRSFTYTLYTVPTTAMRNGDFSQLKNSNGQLETLYDNLTTNPITYQRQPFPNNQIPMSRLSPMTKILYSLTPPPTTADDPLVTNNLQTPGISYQTAPTVTFRLDQSFGDRNKAYLRYTQNLLTTASLNGGAESLAVPGFPAGVFNLAKNPTIVFSGALGFTHVFSPTFYWETVLSSTWELSQSAGGADPNVNYRTPLGYPNNFGNNSFQIQSGLFSSSYVSNRISYSGSTMVPNVDENLGKTIGRHQLFFGGRYRFERMGVLPDQTIAQIFHNGMGTADYDSSSGANYSPLANTGDPNADFFLGDANKYEDPLTGNYLHYHDQEIDSYLQDNFRATKNLTVNVGVRWEIHPAAIEIDGQNNGFDIANNAIVLPVSVSDAIASGNTSQAIITNLGNLGAKFETPAQAGLPNTMIHNSDFTFSPRIGAAYAPFSGRFGTIFRGGFGRYIYAIPLRNFYATQASNTPWSNNYIQDYTVANQSPDGLSNYILRSSQTVIEGVNAANVINVGANAILPGLQMMFMNPHFPPNYVQQANVTIEQPLPKDSLLRLSYIFDHGMNLDQYNYFNEAPSAYVYEAATGQVPPIGQYASVATGPYNQTLWGTNLIEDERNGWSTDNALQVNYQRLYKSGYAFQVFYVYSRAFRVGGNTFSDSKIYPVGDFASGVLPQSTQGLVPWAAPKWLNRFENYKVDTAIPEHHVSFNGIVDIPVGRGKRFLGNAGRFVNELVGGYQIAGDGNVLSQSFQPNAANYGGVNPGGTGSIGQLHVYKNKYPVNDCSSGVCHPGHLWFNGFINPLLINDPCGPSPYSGLPASLQAFQTPIVMNPGTVTCSGTTVKTSNSNYLTNNVTVPLNNGTTPTIAYSPGPSANPFSRVVLLGPFNWSADLSLFKVFPITEKVNLRVNVDAFNAFNIQGYTNPNTTTGLQNYTSSYNTPRQIQLTARLNF